MTIKITGFLKRFGKLGLCVVLTLPVAAQKVKLSVEIRPEKPPASIDLSLPLNRCREYKSDERLFYRFDASDNSLKEGDLIFARPNGKIELLDAKLLTSVWTTELGSSILEAALAVDEKWVYLAIVDSEKRFNIRQISKLTGLVNWSRFLHFSPQFPAAGATGINTDIFLFLYGETTVIAARNGDIYALNKADGGEVWRHRLESNISTVSAGAGKNIIVATADGKIKMLSGSATAHEAIPAEKNAPLLVSQKNKYLFYGDASGNVFASSADGAGRIWKFRAGGAITNLKETEFGVLISSNDNFIYMLAEKTGKVVWKRRMTGRVYKNAPIKGVFGIFINVSEPEADIIELKSGRVVNRVYADKDEYFTGGVFSGAETLILALSSGFAAYSTGDCRQAFERGFSGVE